jgi:hypothetical protein
MTDFGLASHSDSSEHRTKPQRWQWPKIASIVRAERGGQLAAAKAERTGKPGSYFVTRFNDGPQ